MPMRTPDELRGLIDHQLVSLELSGELGELSEAMRYSYGEGGKRIRPVLCLATCEALGCDPERALPAAAALELVHSFSLVHDDLPALDDDAERRGRPTTHVQWGEAVAILAGDALFAEAMRLALTYPDPAIARELAQATLGMIGGQYLDITKSGDLEELHRLKTGRLFAAAIGLALRVAQVPEPEQAPWRAFADELGLLFQLMDDILDRDGYVLVYGLEETRRLADQAGERALAKLARIEADTSVLEEIVRGLAARTS
jgi:geranylgeranyl diphosphate synthase type II